MMEWNTEDGLRDDRTKLFHSVFCVMGPRGWDLLTYASVLSSYVLVFAFHFGASRFSLLEYYSRAYYNPIIGCIC